MGVGGRWKNGKCGMRVASDKWESVADGEEWRERGGEREVERERWREREVEGERWRERGGEREVEREPERESLKEKA